MATKALIVSQLSLDNHVKEKKLPLEHNCHHLEQKQAHDHSSLGLYRQCNEKQHTFHLDLSRLPVGKFK